MSRILIIQGSLSRQSKTAIVAEEAEKLLRGMFVEVSVLDLRSLDMEFCDGRSLKDYNVDTQNAYRMMESADGYIFGMPVYCWSVSGALKNFIDITAGAMENKTAGILCNAGSERSYLASSDLVKILSYESSVLTVHPIVCTCYEDFQDGNLTNPKAISKLQKMVNTLVKMVA